MNKAKRKLYNISELKRRGLSYEEIGKKIHLERPVAIKIKPKIKIRPVLQEAVIVKRPNIFIRIYNYVKNIFN